MATCVPCLQHSLAFVSFDNGLKPVATVFAEPTALEIPGTLIDSLLNVWG
jgi:hypothetical protein